MKLGFNKYFVAFFAAIQLFTAVPFAVKVSAQSQIQQFDDRVMISLAAHRTPEQTGVMLFLSNTSKYVNVGVPVALLAGGIISNDKQMRQNSAYVASSTAISVGVMLLLKHLIKRPRPFVQNINIVPVYMAGGTSFPSGHTSTAFSTAMSLSNAYPKWYVIAPSFLWAGSVGYSRMYLGVHYPTDVAAGAALGTGTALLLQPVKRW
ncbi:phosphatase PAP2 family protein [Mucilaginibacter sp. 14171R-50]|uniref:phosphatase PAP2 family protein n=1 Tax=Mucilaginibacter sp. 14171R-50 TaxID=2703789 RepID=UPI00272C74F5|nr:phosphatase PAP2 family protein [Mucilaginibacter sp. 14171R-50]